MNRVFISGYGIVSAFGKDWKSVKEHFKAGVNATTHQKEWENYKDLNTKLAAPILNYTPPKSWSRKELRSLGRVSQYSVEAAGLALKSAGLWNYTNQQSTEEDFWGNGSIKEELKDGRMGVASGSSTGSTQAIVSMAKLILEGESDCNANTYIKMMPHTTAANIAIFFGLKGRVIPTSSACTSGSQAIGYAYEAIKYGLIDSMIAGGAEELCVSEAYVFDTLYATSTKNTTPKLTPRPFDKDRDGLVLGEGAGMVILESEKSLLARGGTPLAEIVGFGSNCDGTHITRPQSATMKEAMILALKSANLMPDQIGYINAHATATQQGDIVESQATHELFTQNIAISSLKSYLGHTLGACGGLESIFSILMMQENCYYPNLNLTNLDPQCAKLNYLREPTELKSNYVMNNNFAFGGINTSLIFKKID